LRNNHYACAKNDRLSKIGRNATKLLSLSSCSYLGKTFIEKRNTELKAPENRGQQEENICIWQG
jgi:hypothetical protein